MGGGQEDLKVQQNNERTQWVKVLELLQLVS